MSHRLKIILAFLLTGSILLGVWQYYAPRRSAPATAVPTIIGVSVKPVPAPGESQASTATLKFPQPPALASDPTARKWNQVTEAEKQQTAKARPTLRTTLLGLDLSRPPSEAELRMAGQLGDDLTPTGPADPAVIADPVARQRQEADNLLFGRAIQEWNNHNYDKAVELFREHRKSFADSPWAAEAELHCGCCNDYRANHDEAAFSFDWVLGHTPAGSDMNNKALRRRSLLHMARGEFNDAERLMAEAYHNETRRSNKRTFSSAMLRQISFHKSQETAMRDCAQRALARVCEARGKTAEREAVLQTPTTKSYGFKVSELLGLATRHGLPATAVWANQENLDQLPQPWIAHYRDHHYVTVEEVNHAKGTVRLFDSRINQTTVLSRKDFSRLWSGLSVVFSPPDRQFPQVAAATLEEYAGGCCGWERSPDSLGDDGCGGKNCGLPGWKVNPVNMNLLISDTPVWWNAPYGPSVDFTLAYNSQDGLLPIRPFGEKWVLNYASFLMELPNGAAQIINASGRSDVFAFANGAFVAPPDVTETLVKTAAYTYVLTTRNGTAYRYGIPAGVTTTSSLMLSITDKYGSVLNILHNAQGAVSGVERPGFGTWSILYNAQGLMDRINDPFGRYCSFLYDADKRLIGQRDMGGLVYSYAWAKVTAPVKQADNTWLRLPDGPGEWFVSAISTSKGVTTFLTEPADGISALGAVNYPPTGYPMWANYRITITDALGQKEQYHYSALTEIGTGWHFPKSLFPAGATNSTVSALPKTVYRYQLVNGKGKVRKTEFPGGARQLEKGDFTSRSQPQTITDANGSTHRYTYNVKGLPLTYTDPMGGVTRMEYAANGEDMLKVTNALNQVVLLTDYNAARDVVKTTDVLNRVTTIAYNNKGQVASVTSPAGEVLTQTYDAQGWTQDVKVDGKTQASFARDALGRVAAASDDEGYLVRYEYDSLDRVLKEIHPGNTFTLSQWACCFLESVRARDGSLTRFFHDALGRDTATQGPDASFTRYGYDADGRLNSLTDALGRVTRWSYDVAGRSILKTYPDGSTESQTWDGTLPSTAIDRRGLASSLNYDSKGRPILLQRSGLPLQRFTYDALDRPLTRTDGIGTTTFAYDTAGRLVSEDGPWANDTITYAWDSHDRAVSRTINGAAETVAYDALSRVSSTANPLGTFTLGYSGDTGRVLSAAGPVVSTDFAWQSVDSGGKLGGITHRTSGATRAAISAFTYGYNASDEITSWKREGQAWGTGAEATEFSFAYNTAGRLENALLKRGSTLVAGHHFSYDSVGNRLAEQALSGAPKAGEFNTLNQLTKLRGLGPTYVRGQLTEPGTVKLTPPAPAAPVTVTAKSDLSFEAWVNLPAGGSTVNVVSKDAAGNERSKNVQITTLSAADRLLTYDAGGNLLSDGLRRYEWDAADQLTKIIYLNAAGAPDGRETLFTYDGLGRRIGITEKTNGTVTEDSKYLWIGLELAERRDAIGAKVLERYFAQGMQTVSYDASGTVTGTTNYYYTRDHLGSVREVLNAGKELLAAYDYDPYGRRTVAWQKTDANGAPVTLPPIRFGFTGHFTHSQSGLCLAPYRAYDPETGRWLSADPIKEDGGINLYAYCNGNPVRFFDSTGLDWQDSFLQASPSWLVNQIAGIPPTPQGLVDFTAGMGDSLSLHFTNSIREGMGMGANEQINKCSGLYSGGQWTGVALTTVTGGAAAWRLAGGGIRNTALQELGHRWLPQLSQRHVLRWLARSPIDRGRVLLRAANGNWLRALLSGNSFRAFGRIPVATGPTPFSAGGIYSVAQAITNAFENLFHDCPN